MKSFLLFSIRPLRWGHIRIQTSCDFVKRMTSLTLIFQVADISLDRIRNFLKIWFGYLLARRHNVYGRTREELLKEYLEAKNVRKFL